LALMVNLCAIVTLIESKPSLSVHRVVTLALFVYIN
jgi:hypothetical protein